MSRAAAASTDADPPARAPEAGDPLMDPLLDRRLRMLDELAEIGLDIARVIQSRVKAAEPSEPLAALQAAARAYDRVARAVRLSALLRDRLIENRQKREEAESFAHGRRRREHAGRVTRIIARMAGEVGETREGIESLVLQAADRLDTDDIYGEVTRRPVGELVALVCRDLGVDPDWSLWADEAWTEPLAAAEEPMRPPPLPGRERRPEGPPAAFGCDTG